MLIIHWPVNPEAPFKFGSRDEYQLIDKSGLDRGALEKAVADFNLTALVAGVDGFGLQPNRPAMAAEHPRRADLRQPWTGS